MNFKHLEGRAGVLGGKLCIKGTRISVQVILEWLASGASREEILMDYPQISQEAFSEALLYAAQQSGNELFIDVSFAA